MNDSALARALRAEGLPPGASDRQHRRGAFLMYPPKLTVHNGLPTKKYLYALAKYHGLMPKTNIPGPGRVAFHPGIPADDFNRKALQVVWALQCAGFKVGFNKAVLEVNLEGIITVEPRHE